MTDFNTKPLEEKLNRLGKDIQSFFENLVPDEDLDMLNPRADFAQTENGFTIILDLPGLSKNDIKVQLTDNVLTIRGERVDHEPDNHTAWIRRERQFGRFSRSFPIPVSVSASDIKASFADGVLTVTVNAADTDAASSDIRID